MGSRYRMNGKAVECSELIAELEDAWCVRLKATGIPVTITKHPKVFLDVLPGKTLLIADWYYQKRLRHLNEASPVENAC